MKGIRALRVAAAVACPIVALLLITPKLLAEETVEQVIQRAYERSNQKGVDAAIGVLEDYLEEHPKAKTGRARLVLGNFYEQANRKADAKKAYRAVVDADDESAGEAGWRLMNLLGTGFYMWSDRTWGPGEVPQVGINAWSYDNTKKHPDTFECELYKLDVAKLQADWEAKPRGLEQLLTTPPKGSATKLATWEQDWPKNGGSEPLKLEKAKEAGIYVLVAKPHGVSFRMPVVVAPHALVVKRAMDKILVFAADRTTGVPLAGVKLQTFNGKLVELGTTGKDGTWSGTTNTSDVISAWHEGSLAASHGWVYGYYGVGALTAHFSTDRPIYRPGHTVKWKAIIRANGAGGEYTLPETGRTFPVSVHDPNGAEVWKGELKANAYGTFEGEVALKEGCPLGHYYVNLAGMGYYQFRVEEYRKPEYQVKVQAPAFVVQGDSFQAKISAKYYFGAPVTKASVNWEVYRRPHWRPWWHLFPCNDTWFYDDEVSPWGYYYGHGNLIKNGTGELKADGTLTIDVTVDRVENSNQYYEEAVTVVARVVDASRREESGSAEVLAPRASFSLFAQPERWVYRPGDDMVIQVRAMDPESKPQANVKLETTALVREYHRDKGWQSTTKSVASVSGTTDAAGYATLKLSADARGSFEVTVVAKDEKGREVRANCWIWLADEMWASPTHAGIECIVDKRSYVVGDTATILCTMPTEKGSALVTREREGISAYSVQSWEKGVLMLREKIEDKDVPNFWMTVNVVSGALHAGMAEIVVIPEKKLLDVTVSFDKPTYQPREKAIVKVKAVERATKKGAKAEVALGVVDASLYALAADPTIDLRKFYYKKRPHGVSTNSSFQWWVQGHAGGNAAMKEAAADSLAGAKPAAPAEAPARRERAAEGKAKKDAGGDESLVDAQVRKDFPDTWVWRGTLETDENGEATLELTTPDSLTTWRATARAITKETQVGSATAEANVFLPVLVRTEQPRFLVQGDVGGVSALVHNYLDKGKKTKISWKTEGPIKLGKPTITGGEVIEVQETFAWVAIPSLGECRVDWFESKAEKPGAAILEVTAQTDEASDAMRTPAFPVLAHGAPRYASWAGALDEKDVETVKLELPEGSIPEAIALDISMSPSIAGTMLESLAELAGYPYGCVEQTMSRFLPDVVALDALRKLSVDEPKLRADLPKMIVAGLDRLRGFQHGDGGWGWWEHDETHPYMTAYVVYGLSLARSTDVKVDESMYQRGVSALENLLAGKAKVAHGPDEEDPNARAYMVFCLSQAKKLEWKTHLSKPWKAREKLSSYGKAVLARALWRSDRKDEARELCADLVKAASTTGSTAFWDVEAGCHGWMSLNTETTAQALHALEECGEGKELWTKAVKWLVVKRRGRWWYSTKDTAMAVYAMAEHLVRTNELEADEDLTISIGDKELVKEHVDRTNVLKTRLGLKLGAADLGGARTVTFKRSGKGMAYWQANLRTTSFEEDLKASPGAIAVTRSIEVVHREKDGTEKRFALGKEPVQVGDELHVALAVKAGEVREYLLVEDPIPAGCEFVREDLGGEQNAHGRGRPVRRGRHAEWGWGYWYSHREYRDDRLAVCATWLDANHEYRIDYVLRCERPGDFHVLPTRAMDMYNPDVGGTGAEVRLSIR